jgi:hypothetical protein
VPGWVKEDADIALRLMSGNDRSESDSLGDRGIEITHLEVKVHHRTLLAVRGWPDRGRVISRFLKHHVHGSFRRREDGRAGPLVADRPSK